MSWTIEMNQKSRGHPTQQHSIHNAIPGQSPWFNRSIYVLDWLETVEIAKWKLQNRYTYIIKTGRGNRWNRMGIPCRGSPWRRQRYIEMGPERKLREPSYEVIKMIKCLNKNGKIWTEEVSCPFFDKWFVECPKSVPSVSCCCFFLFGLVLACMPARK